MDAQGEQGREPLRRATAPAAATPLARLCAHTPDPSQMLDYNVPLGKLNRGMAVLDVLRAVTGPDRPLGEDESFRAQERTAVRAAAFLCVV